MPRDFTGVEFTGNEGKNIDKDARTTMDVLLVEPGQYAVMTTIGSDLKSMQDTVGGSIEARISLKSLSRWSAMRTEKTSVSR
jgi:hypothetical protein